MGQKTHPTGFRLPGDLGSSDAFTGDPVGVAHLGIWDTTYYNATVAFVAGDLLGVDSTGAVTPNAGGQALDCTGKNDLDDEIANIKKRFIYVGEELLHITSLSSTAIYTRCSNVKKLIKHFLLVLKFGITFL